MLSTSRALLSASLCARSSRARQLGWIALMGMAVYGALAPLLATLHELIVLGIAHAIGDLAWYAASGGLLRALPLDPIYTSAMLLTVGGIEPRGLALAMPVGQILFEQWPSLFQSPDLLAPGAWASAVVAPGSTIVSRWVCGIMADASLVLLGLLAMRRAGPGRRWLTVAGAIIQAHVIVAHVVDAPPSLADVEAAGIPFAVAMIFSGDVQAGPRLAEVLESLAPPVLDAVLGFGMVALAYLPVLIVVLALRTRRGLGRGQRAPFEHPGVVNASSRRHAGQTVSAWRAPALVHPAGIGRLLALSTLAFAVALSPLGDLSDARTRFLAVAHEEEPHEVETAPPVPVSNTTELPAPQASMPGATPAPSIVAVMGAGYRYQYTVNGVPQVIRGMGYNVQYRTLPAAERMRRLDRDFAEMRRAGVNTVFGWEPAEFDTVLLDVAHRHGLGVSPPFQLDPNAAYGDPAVRERLTREVLAWVALYRAHPALRMWSIGNEVLHKLVYPSWMPVRSDPAWERRAQNFATFYVQLIDAVHAADPDHPVIHRDAEDAYLTWLRDEMRAGGRRSWFIYGVNTYTPRLSEILASWPRRGWDVPLLVSEFAPGGMSPADRPNGLREMWKMIRGANGWVLGGSVYAWTTAGPEEVDRVFGLVDEGGQPVDGTFAAISAVYRGAARQAQPARVTPAQVGDARVRGFSRYVISTIQEGRSTDLLPTTADTSIMGDVGNVARADPQDTELTIQRVQDQRRVTWAEENGVRGEWWVTWQPPATPNRQLTVAVQEYSDGTLGVQYIYHGPR